MAMAPYVIVLAKNSQEAAKYAKRAGLTRGRYRLVASAGSIHGLRRAVIHRLPSFDQRPDKHRILAELRHGKHEFHNVVMPPRLEAKAVDQGDGMGQQLTIEDAMSAAAIIGEHADAVQANATRVNTEDSDTIAQASAEHDASLIDSLERHVDRDQSKDRRIEAEQPIEELGVAPGDILEPEKVNNELKNRRRTKCKKCLRIHFKDAPCDTTAAPTGAGMFD
jgi:hypothetical protein